MCFSKKCSRSRKGGKGDSHCAPTGCFKYTCESLVKACAFQNVELLLLTASPSVSLQVPKSLPGFNKWLVRTHCHRRDSVCFPAKRWITHSAPFVLHHQRYVSNICTDVYVNIFVFVPPSLSPWTAFFHVLVVTHINATVESQMDRCAAVEGGTVNECGSPPSKPDLWSWVRPVTLHIFNPALAVTSVCGQFFFPCAAFCRG